MHAGDIGRSAAEIPIPSGSRSKTTPAAGSDHPCLEYDPVLMNRLAQTPKPPYYAVVFSSQRTENDADGYAEMSDRMFALAAQQPGYLGEPATRTFLSRWNRDRQVRLRGYLDRAAPRRVKPCGDALMP